MVAEKSENLLAELRLSREAFQRCIRNHRAALNALRKDNNKLRAQLSLHKTDKLKSIDSKVQAAIILLSELRKEVDGLNRAVRHSNNFILQLIDDPEAAQHAKAVANEYYYKRTE